MPTGWAPARGATRSCRHVSDPGNDPAAVLFEHAESDLLVAIEHLDVRIGQIDLEHELHNDDGLLSRFGDS